MNPRATGGSVASGEGLPRFVDDEIVRVELESVMLLDAKTGKTRDVNGLRLYVRRETPSGRARWDQIFGPLVAFTDEEGVTHEDPNYADLLECAARIIRKGIPHG